MSERDGNPGIEAAERHLDSRGQIILTAIINEHFVTGEPFG